MKGAWGSLLFISFVEWKRDYGNHSLRLGDAGLTGRLAAKDEDCSA